MRIVAVLDVKGGVVVRGVGGRRDEYRPIVSRLSASCRPEDVAAAFRLQFGLDEVYVADLDALAGRAPAVPLFEELQRQGFRLWVDAGVRHGEDAAALAGAADGLVIGLETVAGPEVLAEACRRWPDRVVFSLDLKAGRPLGELSAWTATDARGIAEQAIAVGVKRLLVLDLARVGEGTGCGTEELCAHLAKAHPDVELWAGGGVRGPADLERLRSAGVRVVLVASALHDGRIVPGRSSQVAD
jgi:phosphoribosylformimino-5-aminoimidazole carboxamide ribotide isomerase